MNTEVEDSSFSSCKGWCSQKAIPLASSTTSQDYLLANAPCLSTNLYCATYYSMLRGSSANNTNLNTTNANFIQGQYCTFRFLPYNSFWLGTKLTVVKASSVDYLGVHHSYNPGSTYELYRYYIYNTFSNSNSKTWLFNNKYDEEIVVVLATGANPSFEMTMISTYVTGMPPEAFLVIVLFFFFLCCAICCCLLLIFCLMSLISALTGNNIKQYTSANDDYEYGES